MHQLFVIYEVGVFGLLAAANWFAALPWSSQWLVAAWVLFLGGCFGSFMNVVIYRVPAGLSVVHPGSRCPKCLHAIRGYDNIPVLSWLILRGRCRDCGVEISSRYPTIEALVAVVVLVLAIADVFSGGVTLMRLPGNNVELVEQVGMWNFSAEQLWAVFAGHTLLICTLICAAMIEFDGHSPPRHLFYLAIAAPLIGILAWPPATAMRVSEPAAVELGVFVTNLFLSMVLGAGFGLLLVPIARRWRIEHRDFWPLALTMLVCGLVLGTQAAVFMSLLTAALTMSGGWLGSRWPAWRRLPVLGYVTGLALFVMLGWHRLIVPGLLRFIPHDFVLGEKGVVAALVLLVLAALVSSLTNPDTYSFTIGGSSAKEGRP